MEAIQSKERQVNDSYGTHKITLQIIYLKIFLANLSTGGSLAGPKSMPLST